MKSWRIVTVIFVAVLALGLFLNLTAAAPGELEVGGVVVPVGVRQAESL